MPSFLPSFSRPQPRDRRSFARLRSFHLSPVTEDFPSAAVGQGSDSKYKQHKPNALSVVRFEEPKRSPRTKKSRFSIAISRIDPEAIPPIFWLGLAVIVSVVFVFALACTFRGVQMGEPAFKHVLNDIAENTPGIVLLGENVDIDIDEPSITIRWSILACGEDYTLANSTGIHGSRRCGLPATALSIYVDGDTKPTATFDPTEIPFDRRSGARRSIQNLVQFDSDHVLDVHNAYLYPFDTYTLSSTIRAVSAANVSIPIRKLATMELTSSFLVQTSDIESYSILNTTTDNDSQVLSRDIDMKVNRPPGSRTYALFLFAISWFLAHICLGHVYMAWRAALTLDVVKNILSSGAILAAIPQLRGSMPDAPGLDGVLIDTIGYFPQMVISGLCVVILMIIAVSRELNGAKLIFLPGPYHPYQTQRSISIKPRPPPIPPPDSPIKDKMVVEYNKYRMTKHLKGEFVFPPVNQDPFRDPAQEYAAQHAHRRLKTTVGFI